MRQEIIFQIPKWGISLYTSSAILIAGLFFFMAVKYDDWASQDPQAFKYFLYIVSVVFMVAAYRLYSWKSIVFFKADDKGMYFPCPKLKSCDSDYLFMPWSYIRNIRIEKMRSSAGVSKGIALDLKLNLDQRNQYFPALILEDLTEWTAVGFTEVFLQKHKALTDLNQLKSLDTL